MGCGDGVEPLSRVGCSVVRLEESGWAGFGSAHRAEVIGGGLGLGHAAEVG